MLIYRSFLAMVLFSLVFILASCQNESTVVNPESSTSLNKVVQRDINDFLSTQAYPTYWLDPNDPELKYFRTDFAGFIDNTFSLNLGSTFRGTITEKALSDGTAEVKVKIHANNVLTYVVDGNNVTLFGERYQEIINLGATATLGDAKLDFTFINSAPGAPIPDLNNITTVSRISLTAGAFGPFKEAAGFGPDGTTGHAWTNQVGLLTKVNGHPSIDGFAVEYVKLKKVGNSN